MEYLPMPRFDARTPEGEAAQMKDFINKFVPIHNMMVSEVERRLQALESKGEK